MSSTFDKLFLHEEADRAVRFKVRLTPRSKKDTIDGLHEDALKIRVKAPPVDGKANAALIKLLSRQLGVSKSSITVVTGHTSRTKIIRTEGISSKEFMARLRENNPG